MTQKKSGKLLKKYVFAALAGLLLNSSYTSDLWYLALLAFAILIHLLDCSQRLQRIKLVAVFSSVMFLNHLSWLRVIGNDAWLLVTLISVLPWLLLGILPVYKSKILSLFSLASIVVVIEILRSHFPLGGFPWGLVAFGQVEGPLVNYAEYGGQALVTLIVIITAGLITRSVTGKLIQNALFLTAIFLVAIHIGNATKQSLNQLETVKVTAIQGNVPRLGLDLKTQQKAVFKNHVDLTNSYLSSISNTQRPKLILWPESSTDIDPLTSGEVGNQITEIVSRSSIPILVGATTLGINPEGPRNTGILWNVSDPKYFYFKNHLVPFGEYIPFREVLSRYIDRINLVPNDFVAGKNLGLFEIENIYFGDVICFEIAYGDYIRHLINDGAQFVTVQTNNATYGNTLQPEQQFQISRFRAIEHRRSIVIASTSGISGAINPAGQVLQKSEQFVPAVITAEVPITQERTFGDRYPRWTAFMCVFLTIANFANALIRRKIA